MKQGHPPSSWDKGLTLGKDKVGPGLCHSVPPRWLLGGEGETGRGVGPQHFWGQSPVSQRNHALAQPGEPCVATCEAEISTCQLCIQEPSFPTKVRLLRRPRLGGGCKTLALTTGSCAGRWYSHLYTNVHSVSATTRVLLCDPGGRGQR